MTVIAYDGALIAADRRATVGGRPMDSTRNLLPLCLPGERPRFFLVGLSGTPRAAMRLLRCALSAARVADMLMPPLADELYASALIIELNPDRFSDAPAHTALYATGDGTLSDVTGRPWAIGPAADYAIGAMLAGANAERAAKIACRCCVYCGGRVQTETIQRWVDAAHEAPHLFTPFPLKEKAP